MLLFLLIQVDEKKKAKFELLYEEYKNLIMYISIKILHKKEIAEESFQDSLIKMLINIDDIDEIKCHETKGWVVIISERAALDKLKNESKHIHEEDKVMEYLDFKDVSLEDVAIKDIEVKSILEQLKKLDSKYYSAIILRYYYGYTDRKIAEYFNVSPEVIRKRCERGKKMILKKLSEKRGDENEKL